MGILDPFHRLDALTSSFQPTESTSTAAPAITSPLQSPLSSSSTAPPGPRLQRALVRPSFATAVVSRPSTDFIRAANSAQAAVYSISQTNSDKPGELEKAEVKRKIVALATPLRKGTKGGGIDNGAEKEGKQRRKSKVGVFFYPENDPEIPLRAALKLVDMYPEAVPSQLRHDILEMIEAAQQHANETTELIRPKREGRGEENSSDDLRRLENEIRQLEAEYARVRRKTDDLMKARTAQQFAEADESITSDASPLAQHTARQNTKNTPKSQHGDLTSRLLGLHADDADTTTDFRHLVGANDSLLLEGDTPDISQLMAQTPMKLASSGNWDRPPPSAAEPVEPVVQPKPEHIPLASLGMRGLTARPPPPRTPPRRDEDSFDETPRAGYTYEADGRDESLEEQGGVRDVSGILFNAHTSPPTMAREERVESTEPPTGNEESLPSAVERTEGAGGSDEEPQRDLNVTRMKSFNIKLWSIAGDVLHPTGNGKGYGTHLAPGFAQTKALLKTITEEPSTPAATTDEITRVLTATLLLHLITRDSDTVDAGEEFQAGMNESKELLNQVLDAHGWKREHCQKVIFKWVGKKLLKSEGGRRLRCNLD